MEDEEAALNITPAFKSRSSKGKGRAGSSRVVDDDAGASTKQDSNSSLGLANDDDDDDDAANSSAVLFKKSASKSKGKSLLGGSTTSSSAARKTGSRSRLNVSFGGDVDDGGDDREPVTSRQSSAGMDMADDGADPEGDVSVSEVRKINRKNRKLGGIGSSSLTKTAEKALSNSLSQASIASLADRATSTPSAAGPSYSNDYLNQLKAANVSKPQSNPSNDYDSLLHEEPTSGYNDSSLARYADQDDFTMVSSSSEKLLPTEDAIAAAKARRETARRLGIDNVSSASKSEADDYISLQVGIRSSKGQSRLSKDDDEEIGGDGEDDFSAFTGSEERIALGKKGRKAMERKRKEEMRALIEGEQDDDDVLMLGGKAARVADDDDEDRAWEMAQIRRGAAIGDDDGEPYRPAAIPEQTPLPTLIGTSKRLKNALSELEALKVEDDELLSKSEAELAHLEAQDNDLKAQVESTNLKFEFFAELKAYIQDVASFLSAKYSTLEKMENDNVAFMKERTQEIVGRRRLLDDADDVALFTGIGIKAVMEPKKDAEEGDMQTDDQNGEVDEMGRSRREDDIEPKSLVRRTRRQERAKRRARYLQSSPSNAEEEGFVTDDDLLASDAADLQAAGSTLTTLREKIFEDVQSDEFKDPNLGIKMKFLEWKKRYPHDYRDAFAGLSLVQAWEFWMRVEMASWNPLGIKELPQSPASLDAYEWHSSLTAYQEEAEALDMSAATDGMAPPRGEDESVVNAAVATVILPRLRRIAVEAYDPFSRSMTTKALHVVEEISYCLETTNQRFQYLITGFLSRFQTAISEFQQLIQQAGSAIASPEIGIDMESIQARQRFLQRQMKLLSSAARWRRYTKGLVLARDQGGVGGGVPLDACLVDELVQKCMLPVIEAAWDTGGKEVGQQVLTYFPEGTLPPAVQRRLQGV